MLLSLLQILLNINRNNPKPVHSLHKQDNTPLNKPMLLLMGGAVITLLLVLLCILCITSCTDSGLVYNQALA